MKMLKRSAILFSCLVLLGACSNQTDVNKDTEDFVASDEMFIGSEEYVPADFYTDVENLDFKYLGLNMTLPESLKQRIVNKDIHFYNEEIWEDEKTFSYAQFYWNELTEEQKTESISFQPGGYEQWLSNTKRLATLGVYEKSLMEKLDSITGCVEHIELGKSENGQYIYVLSFANDIDDKVKEEFKSIETKISEMGELSPGHSVFSQPRVETSNVGQFETEDIDGNKVNQDIFKQADLTLVNVFTTWCTPCVEEIPELEKLSNTMKDKKVNVVGFIMDTMDSDEAIQKAKLLKERSNATFPFLKPDETMLNGRLIGLDSFPESFLVDKDGNIVSDPILGSNDAEGWQEILENALKELK